MTQSDAYVPKHRGQVDRPLTRLPRKAAKVTVKTTVMLSALAVGGTGVAVAAGLSMHHGAASTATAAVAADQAAPAAATPAPAPAVTRSTVVSRSFDRGANASVDPTKQVILASVTGADTTAVTGSEQITTQDPQAIASALMASYGWNGAQFGCLVNLWNRESHWNVHAMNPSSGAYGIPQSLPGSKMASAGADWRDNAETQIKWGLGYIQQRYGSPCGAWGHSQSVGWY